MIQFTIYGIPVPKGRPKFFRKGSFVGTYTDKKTRQAEYDFKSQAVKYRPPKPFTEAIQMMVFIYVKIPKSFSIKKRSQAESGMIRPTKRPDLDNYLKLVLDSMNGIFFNDDAQIVDIKCFKYYCVKPRITIYLGEIHAGNTQ